MVDFVWTASTASCIAGTAPACHMLLSAGALPSLVALLKSADPEMQLEAARVIEQLAGHSQQSANAVISAGMLLRMAPECRCVIDKRVHAIFNSGV